MPAAQPIRATRGVRDILPGDRMGAWRLAEDLAVAVAESFGYGQLETPVIEPAELVERGVGAGTDIVTKEMFRFQDRGGRDLVLRPEGTAGTVRAYWENNLNQAPPPARLYSIGPMFRAERPQAGRFRQFYQFNVEAIGESSPALDAEVVELAWTWLRDLGLQRVSLQLNSVGDATCRPAYREALLGYFRPLRERLCADCQARLEVNPLRLLDCKRDAGLVAGAPSILDHLCTECAEAFATVRQLLAAADVPFSVNPRIVRGLDYYTRTAFEFHHEAIGGAQNALGGGGRYDGLSETLGWPPTPGVGFAAGLDRVVAMLAEDGVTVFAGAAEVVVLPEGDLAPAAARVGRLCRRAASTVVDFSRRSLKAKMRSAGRDGHRWAAIFNAEEAAREVVQLRDLESGTQAEVAWDELPARLEAAADPVEVEA